MPTIDEFLDAPDTPVSAADHFLDGGNADSFLDGPKTERETPWRAPSLVPPIQDIQAAAPEFGKAATYVSNVARAIPADIAAGMSVFKRPEGQPSTLLPSPAAIGGAIRKNLPAAAEASGNIPAALTGEQLPIDEILSSAAKDDKTAATIGKISQGLAATAPMAAIGALPAAAQKLALIGFTAKMMSDAPELATQLGDELGKPEDQRDPDKLTSLISDAIQVVGFSTLGAKHLISGGLKTINDYAKDFTPRGQEINFDIDAFDAESQPKEPNALVTETTQPVRGMRPRNEVRQMPTEVGGEETGIGGSNPLTEPPRGPEPIRDARKEAAPEVAATEPTVTAPATESPSELQKQLQDELYGKSEWASATDSIESMPPESGPVGESPKPVKPEIYELGAGVPLPKFNVRKMTPLDVATARHSAKMQLSESNARQAVKEIRKLAKSEDRQSAIALWVEAGGDAQTIAGWATAARGKKFKKSAIAAQNLTPEEIALGRKVINAFQSLYAKGVANDVITNFRDNYVPHIWERPKRTSGFGSGTLKQNFKFNKARTFNTFFEGDQAGFIPKTLSLERIVPVYIKEMDSVIAARQFVKDMAGQLDKDGRPLMIPRGNAKEVAGPSGAATLVFPKSIKNVRDSSGNKIDQSDYKTMENQPALQKWSWVAKDQAGNPIMLQADLSLHPKAYKRIQAMLGTSAIKEWYNQPSEGTAKIPRVIVKALDAAQSEMKKSMFGLLAPFHQVQEGWHGIGHTVNPTFGIPKIDLRDPAQLDAAAHGLMLLPDKASASSYLEGSGSQSSLLVKGFKKVPVLRVIGEVSEMYQDYLFHQYIPGLKFKTYEHILDRNTKRFQSELASGEVTVRDLKLLSAEQSNAAYGHLNYALLDRNPTIQHLIKMAALAPDFLEARGRFTGQAIKGLSSKVGQEQLRAIAFLAATQAGSAFVISQLLGTTYDPKHPFEVVYNGRRYTFRSVPEDIFSLVKDTRSFAYSRMNPLIAKGAIQYTYGLNYRGEKVSPLETTEELLAGYIPIIARSLPGVRELTETSRKSPISPLQQFSGSMGMRISRFSPISETYSLANDWKDAQKLPKDTGSYPVSKYQQLRYALEDGDMSRAAEAYAELRKTMTPDKITTGFAESVNHPFTGSLENDRRFKASLTGYDKEMYELAVRTRANILNSYRYVPKK